MKSTKEGGVAARADTSKVSVKEGEESAEKGTEEINSEKFQYGGDTVIC